MVDSGRSGYPFPYLEIPIIKYKDGTIVYPIDVSKFPTPSDLIGNDVEIANLKNVTEIDNKLGISTYTLENFII